MATARSSLLHPGTDNDGDAESMISDGDGGVFLWWADHRGANLTPFGYSNNALYMEHVDRNGVVRWQTRLPAGQPIKPGNIFQISALDGLHYFSIDGNEVQIPKHINGGILLLRDSIAFEITPKPLKTDSAGNTVYNHGVTRISTSWDSLWYTEYKIIDETNTYGLYLVGSHFVSDNGHGFFDVWRLKDN